MKRILLKLTLIFSMSLFLPHTAFCFSLSDDWSNLNNPNGPWSYNEGSNVISINYADWPTGEFGQSQTAWAPSNTMGSFLPGWFRSVGNPETGYDWLLGDVIVHSTDPGNGKGNGLANVTWTSPFSGMYDIDGVIWGGRQIGRTNIWNFYLNGSPLANGGATALRSNPAVLDIDDIFIMQGSVLKLEIVRTSSAGDFVGVDLNIIPQEGTPVPEPATILVLSMGLLGAFLKRRRV